MRTSILLLFMLSVILNLQAQNYEITFTASGAGATVDEVEVVYLSKADTITVSGTDVLKLVGETTGIPSSLSGDNGLLVYPNPMKAESRIQFYTSAAGVVSLEVFDITGKLVVSSKQELRSGDQTFALSGLHSGLYTLRASTPGQVYSTRVISVEKNAVMPALRHEKSDAVTRTASTLKSGSEEVVPVELDYTDGDWILLKGKSGDHLRVITLIPSESQVVNFEFVACADYDGNNYPIVTLGTQTWMTENLRTSNFNDGTEIMMIEADALWQVAQIPAYCWYKNDETTYGHFGKYYNFIAVSGEKNPCPTGWHVPSLDEYLVLKAWLQDNGFGWPDKVPDNNNGWAAKAMAHIYSWDPHTRVPAVGNDILANNATGLSILGHGARKADATWTNSGQWAFFWTTTEEDGVPEKAWDFLLRYDFGSNQNWTTEKGRGLAVRCIKDAAE